MSIDEILDLWEKDCVIDETNIGHSSIYSSELHRKYLRFHTTENIILKKYKKDYQKLYKIKWQYYLGCLDQEEMDNRNWEPFGMKILKQDLSMYLDSDDELSDEKLKMEIQEEKVNILTKIIDSVNKRSFLINNYIEWKKFENGVS
jgi:hypothetical protein